MKEQNAPVKFSEQVEALCVDRQKHFERALLKGKSLRPRNGQWTLGDLVFLTGMIDNWMANIRSFSQEEFRTPLSEVFG